MAIESSYAADRGQNAALPTLAVFTRDDRLYEGVERFLLTDCIRSIRFKSTSKMTRNADGANLFAALWDTRLGEPDWKGLERLPQGAPVVVLGGPSPAAGAPFGLPVVTLAADTPAEEVAKKVVSLSECFQAGNRAKELEARVAASEERCAETTRLSNALKEHLEFYELQRNQLSEVVRRTAYLAQVSKEINCLDLDKIVDICVTKVPKLVDATHASVYMLNEETGELSLKQANHPYRVTDRILVNSSPQSLMGLAIDKKATLLIWDVDAFSAGLKKPIDRNYGKKYATRSCIVVPLMNDNRVIAVLNLADKVNGATFDEVRDLPLIDHISQFIGIALRNCQLYQKVWHLAKTDALTGFMNHNAFFDELHREIARVRRTKANLSLILLDIDNFKLFNDIHGHQVGDTILSQVAQIIRSSIRTVDVAARYGGDEFAVILGDADMEQARMVAERIRRAIASNQVNLEGQTFFVTISAGIAQYNMGQALSDIVNEADAALYRAKSQGRNIVASSDRK